MVTTSPIIKTRCSQTKEKQQQEQEQLLVSLSFETTSHTQQQKTIVHFLYRGDRASEDFLLAKEVFGM